MLLWQILIDLANLSEQAANQERIERAEAILLRAKHELAALALNQQFAESPNHSPYLTSKEAAAYLRIPYSTFRKLRKKEGINRQEPTKRFRVEDLDAFLAKKRKPKPVR